MQGGCNLARRTAFIHHYVQSGEATSGNNLNNDSSEEKEEARDPSPDVAARQDFLSIMGVCIFRNHVAPRSKLNVPKDEFPIFLNTLMSRDKRKRALVYFRRRQSLSEPWIGVTRFELLDKDPPEDFCGFKAD